MNYEEEIIRLRAEIERIKAFTSPNNNLFAGEMTHDFTNYAPGYEFVSDGTFGMPSKTDIYLGTYLRMSSSGLPIFYKTNSVSANTKKLFGVYFDASNSSYAGIRLDDGSNNNFVECRIFCATTTTRNFEIRYRSGGGTINTANALIGTNPLYYPIIECQITNTPWSSWGVIAKFYAGLEYTSYTSVTGLTWTPTRQGIVAACNSGYYSKGVVYIDGGNIT